jgi:hypothetical protein
MGKLILTGLTKKGRHSLELKYQSEDQLTICLAVCKCGFQERIFHFENYAGVKELESIWKRHTQ